MSEFTLKRTSEHIHTFDGFGVQLNQHVFAKQTLAMAPQASKKNLEEKITVLAPHFVRIFWSGDQDGFLFDPSADQTRWESFLEIVAFAQKIDATINVTWQGGTLVTEPQRKKAASQLADVLEIAVKAGAKNLRWVTIANEPNTVPQKPKPKPGQPKPPPPKQKMTPERLALTYLELDKELKKKGLRKQIRFMGGDLIEGPTKPPKNPYSQEVWFEYMAKQKNLRGLFDAYSAHIYWNYDATLRFEKRLAGVRTILNTLANKPHHDTLQCPLPVYITEFGTRSADRKPNRVDPGFYREGNNRIPLHETNIAPFQAAWFQLRAAQMGYAGLLKWDCHFGKYDNGSLQYFAIGPDPKNPKVWKAYPMYFLLRLFTMTTARGWKVLPVVQDPAAAGAATKHLVAFKGPGGPAANLTILGLDDRGAQLNTVSKDKATTYVIGGLPAGTKLQLVLWNKAGGGKLHLEPPVPVKGGIAEFAVPRHAVFALTSKELPSDLGG